MFYVPQEFRKSDRILSPALIYLESHLSYLKLIPLFFSVTKKKKKIHIGKKWGIFIYFQILNVVSLSSNVNMFTLYKIFVKQKRLCSYS